MTYNSLQFQQGLKHLAMGLLISGAGTLLFYGWVRVGFAMNNYIHDSLLHSIHDSHRVTSLHDLQFTSVSKLRS